MSLPISFDNVSYCSNQFRGDLIITPDVLYYFPHTNVALEAKNRGHRLIDELGLLSIPIDLVAALIEELRTTTNQPRLREAGLWKGTESSQSLQARLDAYIAEAKKQQLQSETVPQFDVWSDPVRYEYKLPKPMRFARSDIRNLSLRGGLWFETEYDSHNFSIGFHRKKLLREALWEGGFKL